MRKSHENLLSKQLFVPFMVGLTTLMACSEHSARVVNDDGGASTDASMFADASMHSDAVGPDAAKVLVPGAPALLFSDLTSGPATGLNDGLGQGTIVTVWGNRLGNMQGSSRIVFVDASGETHDPAYVYYWKAADGQLPGGPADLYTYLQAQEIAFSIPAAAADGEGQIYVEVDGERSNELSFTVRAGEIFYVKAGGDDTEGDGSWDAPWATFGYKSLGANDGASTKLNVDAGDIVYGVDVLEEDRVAIRVKDGTDEAPIALVAYPGHFLRIRSETNGIVHWNIEDKPEYWIWSKWDVQAIHIGIEATHGGRIIANRITDYPDGEGCAEGAAGALIGASLGQQGGSKFFGNHVHDWGCFETSNKEHTTYFAVRNRGSDTEGFELGWNVLKDNEARFGFHFYDEHDCWGYSSKVTLHHNVVINQVGPGFNIAGACDDGTYMPGDFDIYNNVFVENGQLGANNSGIQAISIVGAEVTGHFRIYNNLIYGYGYEGAELSRSEAAVLVSTEHVNFGGFAGTWEFFNNIIVDTHGFPFFTGDAPHTPTAHGNNIWYDPEGELSETLPAWDDVWAGQQADPLVARSLAENSASGTFCPQAGSPAIDHGADVVSGTVTTDLLSRGRPLDGDGDNSTAYDIGPCEYVAP